MGQKDWRASAAVQMMVNPTILEHDVARDTSSSCVELRMINGFQEGNQTVELRNSWGLLMRDRNRLTVSTRAMLDRKKLAKLVASGFWKHADETLHELVFEFVNCKPWLTSHNWNWLHVLHSYPCTSGAYAC